MVFSKDKHFQYIYIPVQHIYKTSFLYKYLHMFKHQFKHLFWKKLTRLFTVEKYR